MAQTQYGTLITTIGLAQIANAQITQTKVGLEYIALGDGNGAHYVPTQNQTALVHEVWRGPIAELSIDPMNSNRIIVDAVIPVTAGGFTIREIGIFDDKNNLIAIGQYPEKYKPQLSEGVSEETIIHFVIETNNADVVKLTIDPTVIIASRQYVDGKVVQVQKSLTEHSVESVASENGAHDLRYFNDKLERNVEGIWGEIDTGITVKEYNGDLNSLLDAGFYSFNGRSDSSNNYPTTSLDTVFIEVLRSESGAIIQKICYPGSGNNVGLIYIRNYLTRWTNWSMLPNGITSTLDNASGSWAASAASVKQVNDKLISVGVAIGKNSHTSSTSVVIGETASSQSNSSVSIGERASTTNSGVAIGASASAGDSSVAIGRGASALNKNEGILGDAVSYTSKWKVMGDFSVAGTKNFEIPHPNPNKKYTHVIRHGAVESPTTGDTLYRYEVEATVDGETVEVQLPDYFEHLNTNVDVWVNPDAHFGRAYGKVVGDKLLVTCEKVGGYKALVIGTRNDDNVQDWYIKGVEREIGESWLGETYVFEVDEISEVTEFEEVL